MAQVYLKKGDILWIRKETLLIVVGDVFYCFRSYKQKVFVLLADGTITWIDAPLSCYNRLWWAIADGI